MTGSKWLWLGPKLITFASYLQWETWYNEQRAPSKKKINSQIQNSQPEKTVKRKLSFKEQNELNTMEARIHTAEKQLQDLTEQMTLPENMQNTKKLAALTQSMSELQKIIEELYERWSELESRLL